MCVCLLTKAVAVLLAAGSILRGLCATPAVDLRAHDSLANLGLGSCTSRDAGGAPLCQSELDVLGGNLLAGVGLLLGVLLRLLGRALGTAQHGTAGHVVALVGYGERKYGEKHTCKAVQLLQDVKACAPCSM